MQGNDQLNPYYGWEKCKKCGKCLVIGDRCDCEDEKPYSRETAEEKFIKSLGGISVGFLRYLQTVS